MNLYLETITALTRRRLGFPSEAPDIPDALRGSLPDLDAFIEGEVPLAAESILLGLSAISANDIASGIATPLPDSARIGWMQGGIGVIPLPEDCLRMVIFRMSDWERSVTQFHTPDDYEFRLRDMKPEWMHGCPHQPRCYIVPNASGAVLEFHSCDSRQSSVMEGMYIPRPAWQTTSQFPQRKYIRFPASLRDALADALAAKVKESLKLS